MKKTRAISLLLSLSLICAMLVPGAAAFAENESPSNSGMVINKTATANTDGSYTIQLEAYATGSKVISEITKDVPTDIILVLDQSGSMADPIGAVSFEQYKDSVSLWGETTYRTRNQDYYEYRHNGGSSNLWHKLADGSYVSVSVTKQEELKYTPITNGKNNSTYGGATSYWDNRNNLYALVDDEYLKVTVERDYDGTYTYTLPDGKQIASQSGWYQSPTFAGIEGNVIYLATADDAATTYTYTYTDPNGNEKTIGTSKGATTVFSPTLYERVTDTTSGGSRLNALKSAATSFANQVATKANGTDGIAGTGDDVKHRIAVVGYAGSSSNLTNGFKQMNNTSQAAYVSSAINKLTADGGTHIDQGLSTANGIFASNPIGDTENRNRVVIVFTDGAPGSYGDWCSESVQTANNAIAYAKTAKNPTSEGGYGATVYTIGIFSGADASNPDSLPAYTSYTTGWFDDEQSPSKADQVKNSNRFMHLVSSNYPDASSITQPGSINPNLNGKSYYLSAADSGALNSIFQQISDQIETGGSSTTLSSETVIKDIIAPAFTLPQGATASDITLETYKCTGKNGDAYTWTKNANAMGATATVNGDQVSVTGFNFAENYVGTVTENGSVTYRGDKLVISFKVEPKKGFLGGNAVITNTSAGVYENSDATKPVLTFPQPDVDVTIKEPTITLPDANVYLGAYFSETVNADDLKKGTSITFGDNIVLDLTKPDQNWGLEDWQTEYVTITVTVTDEDGNEVTEFDKLMDDTEYKVSVSIKPITPKDGNNGYDKSMGGTIHVFKPVLTFKDSNAYYGEAVPASNVYSSNKVGSEVWKHGDITSTDEKVTMLGTKPSLEITYTPDSSKIVDDKYTKQDVPVKATVKIGTDDVSAYTTFIHQDCTDEIWTGTNGDPAFMVHIKTCQLTITKEGGTDGEPYVFTVYKDDAKYTEATIVGNNSVIIYELPVGKYTIAEDTGWSWQFSPAYTNNGVELSKDGITLSKDNASDEIICTNSKVKDLWLNGFSAVVKNVFGIKH